MTDSNIIHWEAPEAVNVPASASGPGEIAPLAKRLTVREQKQLVQAFDAGLYEMGASFVWSRTMAGLKSRLEDLGIEFLAEMLDRQDIRPGAEIHEVITDYEAVRLSEDLGIISSTQALRLRQTLELIAHFAHRSPEGEDDEMMPEEAVRALRTCVQAVLGHENLNIARGFADFRRRLETSVLDDDAPEVTGLASSAYFFKRTVLRTLLASAKSTSGAQAENALANLNIILPPVWPSLKDPDRFTVGRAYAELHADGHAKQANGLRAALLKVSGFDYVPESLRSRAFSDAAAKVITAHFGFDNFYNEPAPMKALASLGTSIPGPAFHKCMTAIILVRIGNPYGQSIGAQSPANDMLKSVTTDRWLYFFDECLPVDDTLLAELANKSIATRWCAMVEEFPRARDTSPTNKLAAKLLDASRNGDIAEVVTRSQAILASMR